MQISFWGAAGMVTGSCYELHTTHKRILIDCGIFQGEDSDRNQEMLPDCQGIADVLVTHAHADHIGRIPILYRSGYTGKIWATPATVDLAKVMLKDTMHMEGNPFSAEDVKKAIEQLHAVPYGHCLELADGLDAHFYDAAHILGSASILVSDNGKSILFSGDVGSGKSPLLGASHPPVQVDHLIMESTYGDRVREKDTDLEQELGGILHAALERGGNVVIPAFAVERTQDLLLALRHIIEQGIAKPKHVFVDSPLGIEVTEVFCQHSDDLQVDEDGKCPLYPASLQFCQTVDDSRAINDIHSGAVIIASGGMCEGGRIVHHLKRNLAREESCIVFVGYQAKGTLGHKILEGINHVHLIGDDILIHAEIKSIEGLSAHADRDGLLSYVEQVRPSQSVYLVHGEEEGLQGMAEQLEQRGYDVHIPQMSDQEQL